MFHTLQGKPFYFLTDRQTRYQYLVVPKKPQGGKQFEQNASTKYLYYPEAYETMTIQSINKHKKRLVFNMLYYGFTNNYKGFSSNDAKIIKSKIIDLSTFVVGSIIGARLMRRFLFRLEYPVFENFVENTIGINLKLVKALLSYGIFSMVAVKYVSSDIQRDYLIDLAMEYQYLYAQKGTENSTKTDPSSKLDKPEQIYQRLSHQRFTKRTDDEL